MLVSFFERFATSPPGGPARKRGTGAEDTKEKSISLLFHPISDFCAPHCIDTVEARCKSGSS